MRLLRLLVFSTLAGCTMKASIEALEPSSKLSEVETPVVVGISSSLANGAYKAGDVIPVTVTFGATATVSGNPRLLLETGASDQYATYSSGSGSKVLTFDYTVQAGDDAADLDYVGTTSLELNGGTINAGTGPMTLTLPNPGAANSLASNKNIVVDTVNPTLAGTVTDGTYFNSLTSTPSLSWPAAADTGSGIAKYQLAVGTSAGGTQVLNWTDIGNLLTYQYIALLLTEGTTYYPSIQAVDAAGNISPVIQGNGWIPDVTAPAFPTVFELTVPTPNSSPSPSFRVGAVVNGNTVKIYSDATCTTQVGSMPVFTSPQGVGLTTPLAAEGTYTYYANVVDPAGNATACTSGLSYVYFIPSLISFSYNYYSRTEGSSDLTMTVQSSYIRNFPITVTLDSSGSTAVSGTHFNLSTTSVVIPANQSTATFTVSFPQNALADGMKYLQINIAATDQTQLALPSSNNSTRIYIDDDDSATNTVTEFMAGSWRETGKFLKTRACAIVANKLKCWGDNSNSYLGDGTSTPRASPVSVDAANDYSKIYMGRQVSCGKTTLNKLRCWGHGNYVGDGSGMMRASPVNVDNATNYSFVSLDEEISCGITTANKLKCWGTLSGNGTTNAVLAPTAIDAATDYAHVFVKKNRACAVTTAGVLKCWGGGKVGDGTTNQVLSPTIIDSGTAYQNKVSIGYPFGPVCGITVGGALKCWGNGGGMSGGAPVGDGSAASVDVLSPSVVDAGTSYAMVESSYSTVCGITTTGVLKCWASWVGEPGFSTTAEVATPTVVDAGTTYQSVKIFTQHPAESFAENVCALTTSNKLKCWGRSYRGGGGFSGISSDTPIQISDDDISDFWLAGFNGYAKTTSGVIISWGENLAGQLGTGIAAHTPALVDGNTDYSKIVSNDTVAMGLTTAGDIKCWGGTCPNGSTAKTPITFASGFSYLSSSAGCGITTLGALKCWGSLSGDGTLNKAYSPLVVDAGTSYSLVASSMKSPDSSKCAISTTGVLKCWGTGYLGNGSTTQALTPVVVDSGTSYSKVALDDYTMTRCAITTTGVLKCWGLNANGEVGVGSTVQVLTPTVIDSGQTFTDVTMNSGKTCATRTSGLLRCWGYQYLMGSPYLGDGTGNPSTSPINIDAGYAFNLLFTTSFGIGTSAGTCGVTSGGLLRCWGYNQHGEIGWGGGNTNQTSPFTSDGGNTYKFTSDAVSLTHSLGCGILAGGGLKCWGWDMSSGNMIGDGSFEVQFPSVRVPTLIDSGTSYQMVQTSGAPQSSDTMNGTAMSCGLTTTNKVKCWGSSVSRGNGRAESQTGVIHRVQGL